MVGKEGSKGKGREVVAMCWVKFCNTSSSDEEEEVEGQKTRRAWQESCKVVE